MMSDLSVRAGSRATPQAPAGLGHSASIPDAIKFLEDAAGYFERRPTRGEDRAHWSNVFNAQNCQKVAALLTAKNDALGEIVSAFADARDVFPDWENTALAMAQIAEAAHEDAIGDQSPEGRDAQRLDAKRASAGAKQSPKSQSSQ